MMVPRVWVRAVQDVEASDGRPLQLCAWGWSLGDRAEAERRAAEKLERLLATVQQGLELSRGYGYGSGPLREELLQEVQDARGGVSAAVTRNSYGCRVLNTARIWFADIDLPQVGLGERIGRLFGRKSTAEEDTLKRVVQTLRNIHNGCFRLYRTAGGFRVMATYPLFDPLSEESERLLVAVGADPFFIRLCRAQQSFRARLTPKPWRCGCQRPPVGFPRETPEEQKKFDRWLARYEKEAATRGTCRLLEQIGDGFVHDEVQPVLRLHDEETRIDAALPLA